MQRLALPFVIAALFLTSAIFAQRQSDAPREIGEVLLNDGTKSVSMKYSISAQRGHKGFSSTKEYFVFGDPKARIRTESKTPTIEFNADAAFNVESGVYIWRFDNHKDRREIRVAKGKNKDIHYSIPSDHVIATTLEEVGDGPNGTKRYRMKPKAPLGPGEYCLARSSDSCFDFGVD
ncbi:MAG: hypothetical protein AUJ04_02505 [Acidobacteria bacterium 13_1_40CM_3_55_6]|nr:MAG: hypothetical protein AUJ04_02505 [Acidobacteria bacterium 13_1_40CM_3_55_6]